MNNNLKSLWSGFSASIIGSGHIKRGLPCQDASTVVTGPRPALIVCDGRGSASRSQDGASAAVRDFTSQCAVFEPLLATILDADEADAGRWEQFCRILYRTLMQTKLNLSAEHNVPEKEFDFTVAAAVVGKNWIGCFQVGDGAIVLRQNGTVETAFSPDKGEFANQTHFLRENGEAKGKFHAKLFSAKENSGIAITSDGPEHLMFHLATMTPGKIFGMLFDDMQNRSLTKQDIMDYLTRREWDKDPRGQDDRSIAILAPELAQQGIVPEPEVFNAVEETVAPQTEEETDAGIPENHPTFETSTTPQSEEENTGAAANGCQSGTSLAVPHNEEKKAEPSPASDSSAADCTSPENGNETERGTTPEHTSSANTRNTLISGGITGAAVVVLLLSTIYFQSELKAMRQELNRISAQQTITAQRRNQPVDEPVTEYLRQTPDSTIDGQTPAGTADDEEKAHAGGILDDNALAETKTSENHSFFPQETEGHFLKDEETKSMIQGASEP
jgi:serine/threonine protein phosphatase PrpC